MKNKCVKIDHGIVFRKKNGKTCFYATKGTDKNRKRIIYMTDEVYRCFVELRKQCFRNPSTLEVDGYKNFVFVSKTGMPLYPIRKVYDNVSLERVRKQMEKLNHKDVV